MKLRLDPYQDLRGEWRWRLIADNGRIIADSSEGYATKANLKRAMRKVVAVFPQITMPHGW